MLPEGSGSRKNQGQALNLAPCWWVGVLNSILHGNAVVVPLWTHARNSVPAIVRQAENVFIAAGRRRMDTVRAVQFLAAPPGAGAKKVVGRYLRIAFEDEKSPPGHFAFERLHNVGRRIPG